MLWKTVGVVAAVARSRLGDIVMGVMIMVVLVSLWAPIRIKIGEVILGDLWRAAAGVGGEGGVAARGPPAGHRKEEDEERAEGGEEDGWG